MNSIYFEFGESIGKGAFGEVFLAEVRANDMSPIYKQCNTTCKQKAHPIKVAVKVLKGDNFLLSIFFHFYNVRQRYVNSKIKRGYLIGQNFFVKIFDTKAKLRKFSLIFA